MNFIPDSQPSEKPNRLGYAAIKLEQAYLEDGLAGYTTTQTEKKLQGEIMSLLISAGATDVSITPGKVDKRMAFRLRFVYEGILREIIQVALPTRTRTDRSTAQAQRQALFNLHDSIRMELERRHYQPNIPAFVAYMLMPGENRTLAQMVANNDIPALPAEVDVLELAGEIVDAR